MEGVEVVKIISIVAGLLFIVNYFFSKKLYIAATAGQAIIAISFKKSVIENVPITLEKSLEAIGILNNVTTASHYKS